MADRVGQIYVPSGAPEIRDRFLRDVRLAAIAGGVAEPPVTPGTDLYLIGDAVANTALIGYANGAISDEAQSVLTAVGDDLEEWRIAFGLPPVDPTGAAGKIKLEVFGPTTLVAGTQFILPSGLRGQVVGNYLNPADGDEVDVQCIDTGEATNLVAGTVVRFVTPPTNIAEEATVSEGTPLTGGTDAETDGRKRARILNTLQNKPAGGNWAHLRQIALDSLGSVVDCYVYPALGGPGSCLVVPIRDYDRAARNFTRALSSAALQVVRAAIQSQVPNPQEIVVRAAADESVDITVLVTIPNSSLTGGNGQGWIDQQPWPPLVGGDSNKVTISAVGAGNDSVTVTAQSSVAPYPGQTNIAWWSSVDMEFKTALVISVSGSAGARVLGLDRPLVSSDGTGPTIGDYISPAAQNLAKYGEEWVYLFGGGRPKGTTEADERATLGPGEMTTDVNRLPRSKRHPFAADEDPFNLSSATLGAWARKFPEMSGYTFGHAPQKTPTVPAGVNNSPNSLKPRRFAIYAE